ncbi:MAG: transposase [Syntrophomonadaceae bacterium]|nr:transposase [Syntrophomonadaceae bacterium]
MTWTRRRKIDPDELRDAVEEKPGSYLRELAEKSNCSIPSVHNRLVKLGFTYKKRRLHIPENHQDCGRSF